MGSFGSGGASVAAGHITAAPVAAETEPTPENDEEEQEKKMAQRRKAEREEWKKENI